MQKPLEGGSAAYPPASTSFDGSFAAPAYLLFSLYPHDPHDPRYPRYPR